MKKAVVIGASGHLGSYLIPQLVRDGYDVVAIARNKKNSYTADSPEWGEVEQISADRSIMEESGTFGQFIANFNPDVVCDSIAFRLAQTKQLCESLNNQTHLIHIGTIWVYEKKYWVPITEDHPRTAKGKYGFEKTQIEQYLKELNTTGKSRATIIQPGHICGRGWIPINPQGNLNPDIFRKIINGEEIVLPDDGQYTLHHVHSQDIALLISACLNQPEKSIGECFHAVTSHAVTLEGYANLLYERYGKTPNIRFMPWDQLKVELSSNDADLTWDHMSHSPVCSMEKAARVLGFHPSYSSIDTVLDALMSGRDMLNGDD